MKMAASNLKGLAVQFGIESGIISKTEKGYNIAPFLKFWDMLNPHIEAEINASKQIGKEMAEFGKYSTKESTDKGN